MKPTSCMRMATSSRACGEVDAGLTRYSKTHATRTPTEPTAKSDAQKRKRTSVASASRSRGNAVLLATRAVGETFRRAAGVPGAAQGYAPQLNE